MTKTIDGGRIGDFLIDGLPQYAGLTGERGEDGGYQGKSPDTSSPKWEYAVELAQDIVKPIELTEI